MRRTVPGKPKVEVGYERVETKVPFGLYSQMEKAVRELGMWPSRQDFVIEAIKEKLDRLAAGSPAGKTRSKS